MSLFLLRPDTTYYVEVFDFITLCDLVPVNFKKVSVTLILPMPWKRQPVLLYMPSLHFCLSSLLMRWQYSCALAVLWKMNVFITPGCRVTFNVFLLITDQQSFDGRTAGAGLMGVGVGDLMAVKWLSMKSWTWRLRSLVLYL